MSASMDINAKGFYTTPGIGGAVVRVFHHPKADTLAVAPIKGPAKILSVRKEVEKHAFNEKTSAVTTSKHEVTEISLVEGQVIAVDIRWKGRAPARITISCEKSEKGLRLVPLRADWEPNEAFDVLSPPEVVEYSRFSRI